MKNYEGVLRSNMSKGQRKLLRITPFNPQC